MKNFASKTEDLKILLRKGVKFIWSSIQQECFVNIKKNISKSQWIPVPVALEQFTARLKLPGKEQWRSNYIL